MHSLRFLYDAFRARPDCLAGFRDQLEGLLARELSAGRGLLAAKIALEATGLLKPESTDLFFAAALETGDPWLSDTALRACRHLPKLSRELEDGLKKHIASLPVRSLLARRKELLFSLGLSDAFASLYRLTWLKCAWIYLLGICVALLVPMLLFAAASIFGFGAPPGQLYLGVAASLFISVVALASILPDLGQERKLTWREQWGEGWRERLREPLEKFVKMVLFLSLLAVAGVSSIRLLTELSLDWLGHWILGGIAVASLAPLIYVGITLPIYLVRFICHSVGDWRRGVACRQSIPTDRARIESELSSFKTRWARLRYVESLAALRIKPTGVWSQGLLWRANDPASTRLAQLEERWLGLAER